MLHKLVHFLLLAVICIAGVTTAAARNSDNKQLEQVSLQLKWLHSFQFAGYYAAVQQGYYRAEGLDVTLIEPLASNAGHLIKPVLAGDAQYGIWSSDLINERLSGKAVVLLAVIFQHSPYIVLSRKDTGIRTPSDLIGKKVAIGSALVQFQAMLSNEGLSFDAVDVVARTGSIDDIIDGRADAVLNYITDQPHQMRMLGVEYAMLRPIDYGIDFYGDSLFTSETEIKQHPQRVAAFLRASLQGWEYAMSHEAELIDVIMSLPGVQERGLTVEHLSYEAEQMHKLILPALIQIGHINPGRLKHIADTYVNLGLLDPNYSLKGFVYQAKIPTNNILIYTLLALLLGTSVVIIIGWNWNRRLVSVVGQQPVSAKMQQPYKHQLVDEMLDCEDINISVSPSALEQIRQPINISVMLSGALVLILGASVLYGWATHNVTLIQVSAAFVPMQFNTALGFLLSGFGVLVITRRWCVIGLGSGMIVLLIGVLTLIEYIFAIDLNIDQLLMQHDITVLTSHPGRMAPNTALCFTLVGTALAVQGTKVKIWQPSIVVGIMGSLTLGLSIVALSGYAIGIETAYGWGELTRMAVHTAIGFIFLGVAITSLALRQDFNHFAYLPTWFPIPVGIGVVTIVISLWQALESQETALMQKYGISGDLPYVNEILLVIGIILAVALSMAAYLAQTARHRKRQLEGINGKLLAEIDERKVAEKALQEEEERFRGLFENVEVSIWNEDFLQVSKELNILRGEGVSDIRQYLSHNEQKLWDMVAMVKVHHVNQATLKLFGANSESEFLYQIDKTFGPGAIDVFIDELCAIWSKQKDFRSEVTFHTLDGREISTIISFRIPELEENFQSIPVSIIDITESKQAEVNIAEQLNELHRWHNTMLEREGRGLELKAEVNALLVELGQLPRYPSAEDND